MRGFTILLVALTPPNCYILLCQFYIGGFLVTPSDSLIFETIYKK